MERLKDGMQNKFYTNTETDEKQKKQEKRRAIGGGARDSHTNFTFKYVQFNVSVIKLLLLLSIHKFDCTPLSVSPV